MADKFLYTGSLFKNNRNVYDDILEEKNKPKNKVAETGIYTGSLFKDKQPSREISGAGYLGGSLGVGIASPFEGITDLVTASAAWITGDKDYAEYVYKNNVTGGWQNALDEKYLPGKGMQTAGEIAGAVGQVISYAAMTILTSGIASGAAGGSAAAGSAAAKVGTFAAKNAPIFASSLGGYTGEAVQTTGELGGKEVLYGFKQAIKETALEQISAVGGIVGRATGKTGAMDKALSKVVKNTVARGILSDAAGEFVEESLSELITPALKRSTGVDPEARTSAGQVLKAGLIGAASGAIVGGMEAGTRAAVFTNTGAKLKQKGSAEGTIKTAKLLVDNMGRLTYEGVNQDILDLKQSLESYAKSPSNAKLGEIASQMYIIETKSVIHAERAKILATLSEDTVTKVNALVPKPNGVWTMDDIRTNNGNIATIYATAVFANKLSQMTGDNSTTAQAIESVVVNDMGRVEQDEAATVAAINSIGADGNPNFVAYKMPIGTTVVVKTKDGYRVGVYPDRNSSNAEWSGTTYKTAQEAYGALKTMGGASVAKAENKPSTTANEGEKAQQATAEAKPKKAKKKSKKEAKAKVVSIAKEGQFYEIRGDDAVIVSEALGLVLTQRTIDGKKVPMVGFPLRFLETYIKKAAKQGIAFANKQESENTKHSPSEEIKKETKAEETKAEESKVEASKEETKPADDSPFDRKYTAEDMKLCREMVEDFDFLPIEAQDKLLTTARTGRQAGANEQQIKEAIAFSHQAKTTIAFSSVIKADGMFTGVDNDYVIVVNPKDSRTATIIHEMAHRMKKTGNWDALEKYVRTVIGEEQFNAIRENYKKSYDDWRAEMEKGGTVIPELTDEQLDEEAVADALAYYLKKVPYLENKARKGFIQKAYASIVSIVNMLKNKEFATYKTAVRIQHAYEKMLTIVERDQAMREARKIEDEVEKRYSFSSISQSFFGTDVTVDEMESGSYKETEGYKEYVGKCLNNMRQSVEGFNEAEARKEIEDSIDGIVKVAVAMKKAGYDILDDALKRDKTDSKKRLLFSSLEPNSDYFTSSDISTICDKRKNFTEIYEEIVRREEKLGVPREKRFFSNVDNYFVIHKIMADKGLTQPCEQCYVESMRKNLGRMANAFLQLVQETDPNNKSNAQLYQVSGKNKGEVKSNNFKLREDLLKTIEEQGYDITVDKLTVEMLTTGYGLADLKLRAPLIYEAFNSFYGQSKPKLPKEAVPFRFGELTALLTDHNGNINKGMLKRIKSTGGFRLQSYSDFQIQNFVDVLQVIFEAGTLGLNGHAYTKVPAFLDATKNTNLKRNISIFMYNDGGEWKIDRNDSFPYTLEAIYDIVKNDESGNTSIIAVSQNEMMSAWVMANDNIGYFIPFHKSGMKMGAVRETIVREGGREILGYSGIKDHTRQQSEVWADTKKKVNKGINIYGFWDFSNAENLSQKELIEKNVKRYIDACEEAGYLPKFREYVMNNGKVLDAVLAYSKQLGFSSQDATVDDISFTYKGYRIPYGYYKCLGDFGMFKPNGEASPIERLSLKDYDFDDAVDFFSKEDSLRRTEILQQIANGEERERYVSGDKKNMTTADIEKEIQAKRKQVADEIVEDTDVRYSPSSSRLDNLPTVQRKPSPAFYSRMGKEIDGIRPEKVSANGLIPYLKGKGVKDEEIKWSGIEAFLEGKKSVTKADLQEFVAGSQLQIEEKLKTEEYSVRWKQYSLDGGSNYRELVFKIPNSTYTNQAMRVHWGDAATGVLAHARIQDMTTADGKRMLFIEEIQSDWHNAGRKYGYKETALSFVEDTKMNISITKKILDAYRDEGMAVENGQILPYIRGEEKGFYVRSEKGTSWARPREELILSPEEVKYMTAKRAYIQELKNPSAPDAPFRDTYHEYVLKRLIRMAAEEGYGSIGWTTADIQSQRWSDEYAEGYRIEYDQDIPKFLRKYGKKWGATVGKTVLEEMFGSTVYTDRSSGMMYSAEELPLKAREIVAKRLGLSVEDTDPNVEVSITGAVYVDAKNDTHIAMEVEQSHGTIVWSMDITDSMKESVLYEGQPMYSPQQSASAPDPNNPFDHVDTTMPKKEKLTLAQARVAMKEFLESAQVELTNQQAAIENFLVRKGKMKRAEAASWVQAVRTSEGYGIGAVTTGQYSADGKRVGDGLFQILSHLWDKKNGTWDEKLYHEFAVYITNLHNIDRQAADKPVIPYMDDRTEQEIAYLKTAKEEAVKQAEADGKSQEDIDKIKEQYDKDIRQVERDFSISKSKEAVALYEKKYPKFKEIAEQLSTFNRNLNQYRVDTGLLSKKVADELNTKYPHYIPTYRVEDGMVIGTGSLKGKYNFEVQQSVKTAKGSDKTVDNPILTYIHQTISTYKAGRVNQLLKLLHDNADGEFVVTEENNKPKTELEADDETGATEYGKAIDITTNELTYWDNGKKVTIRAHKKIFAGFEGFTTTNTSAISSMIVKGFAKVNNLFKAAVTSWNPFFLATNFFKDTGDALFYSKFGAKTWAWARVRAQKMIHENHPLWQEYISMGGLQSSIYDFEQGFSGNLDDRGMLRKAKMHKDLQQRVENVNIIIEQASRFTEYILSRESGLSVRESMLNAADVTINFSRGGRLVKVANKTFMPFLNPAVQGMSKIGRTFFEDRTKGDIISLVLKCVALGILPMMLANLMYGNDEEYDDLQDTVKENNYLFRFGDTWIKIPKGRVQAVLSGAYNRTERALSGKSVDVMDYLSNVASQATPLSNISRTIISPFKDVQTNTTWYGGTIETQGDQLKAPKDRYDEYTSELSKGLAKVIPNTSPKKWDYFIDQTTGVIGDILLPATTANSNALQAFGKMGTNRFIVNTATSSRISSEFYDIYEKTTYKKSAGDEEAYFIYKYLSEYKDAATELYDQIDAIQVDETLSTADKNAQSKALRVFINQTFKSAITDLDTYKSALSAAMQGVKGAFSVVEITQDNRRQYDCDKDDIGRYAVLYNDQKYRMYDSLEEAEKYVSNMGNRMIYAESIRLVYGAERAIKSYNASLYEKAQALNSLGIGYEIYYNAYFGTNGMTKKETEQYIASLGLSKSQRNVLMYALGYSSYKKQAEKEIQDQSIKETLNLSKGE